MIPALIPTEERKMPCRARNTSTKYAACQDTNLLPIYYRSTTNLLQIYYRSTTDLLQIYYQSTTDLLPIYYRSSHFNTFHVIQCNRALDTYYCTTAFITTEMLVFPSKLSINQNDSDSLSLFFWVLDCRSGSTAVHHEMKETAFVSLPILCRSSSPPTS